MPMIKRKPETGFTLIEVMVALLIVGVGLLGVAGMQSTAMKRTQDAYSRSQASALGSSIINSMRTNGQAVRDGDYTIGWDATGPGGPAGNDLTRWQNELDAALPGAQGRVTVNQAASGAINRVVVDICWQGRRASDQQNAPNNNPDCPQPQMNHWTMSTQVCSGGDSSCM